MSNVKSLQKPNLVNFNTNSVFLKLNLNIKFIIVSF